MPAGFCGRIPRQQGVSDEAQPPRNSRNLSKNRARRGGAIDAGGRVEASRPPGPIQHRYVTAADRLPGTPGRRTLRSRSTGHPTASFFARSVRNFGPCPQAARAALSERKSGLEMGVDAAKTTQDAIGPAARRPLSCGFAGGLIGTACNPLKPGLTSDNSQYVNHSPKEIGPGPRTNSRPGPTPSSSARPSPSGGPIRQSRTPTPRSP